MTIKRLHVSGLRNLREVRLDNCGRINIVSGANGSGKTSLLEAAYLLGSGRSFRSSRLQPLISQGMKAATVFAEVIGADGVDHLMGLSREVGGEQRFRLDRRPALGAVELARVLPVQILDADSFSLIDGGPAPRRRYLDWVVFHVKPKFHEVWQRAQKALRQRNHLLRHPQARAYVHGRMPSPSVAELAKIDIGFDIKAWEVEFAFCAVVIDGLRKEVMDDLKPLFQGYLADFGDLPEIALEYRRGWKAGEEFLSLLEEGRGRDRERGFTQIGPHRANLEIKAGGIPAADYLSRGQQKLVVSALRLAQSACLAKNGRGRSVFLVDDLPAELDQNHRATLCRLLDKMGSQVFITSVDADVIESAWFGLDGPGRAKLKQDDVKRFHVEQGEYKCQTI